MALPAKREGPSALVGMGIGPHAPGGLPEGDEGKGEGRIFVTRTVDGPQGHERAFVPEAQDPVHRCRIFVIRDATSWDTVTIAAAGVTGRMAANTAMVATNEGSKA